MLLSFSVAVNRSTGDFIVTERAPTHQIQVFNAFGQFLHKFGADVLQHPRGICVDHEGRIIVVECKVRLLLFLWIHMSLLLFRLCVSSSLIQLAISSINSVALVTSTFQMVFVLHETEKS